MITDPENAISFGLASLAWLFLRDEYLIDKYAEKASEMRVCEDTCEDIGYVGQREENSTNMIAKDDGKVHVPSTLIPFLFSSN
jgi:hypothetical protein